MKKSVKKLIVICLTFTVTINIFAKRQTNNTATAQANQQEYKLLLNRCQQLKAQFLKDNSFEIIRTNALQNFRKNMSSLRSRMSGLGGSDSFNGCASQAENNLLIDLAAQEVCYNAELRKSLLNYISIFLRGIGSPVALKLLSNLALSDFFVNITQG